VVAVSKVAKAAYCHQVMQDMSRAVKLEDLCQCLPLIDLQHTIGYGRSAGCPNVLATNRARFCRGFAKRRSLCPTFAHQRSPDQYVLKPIASVNSGDRKRSTECAMRGFMTRSSISANPFLKFSSSFTVISFWVVLMPTDASRTV
jgi:hypothetical protein